MIVSDRAAVRRQRYWPTPLVRAIVALVAAAVVTFTANHSPHFGLIVFGAFAVISGVVIAVLSWRALPAGTSRTVFGLIGLVGVIAGILALALNHVGLGLLMYLVTVWALVTGFLELYAGFRSRGGSAPARDWMVVGALTVLLAIAFLLTPPDFHDAYRAGPDHGVVTAPIVLVGLLGAYQAVLGVYLVIMALSLKWGTSAAKARGSEA